ncbi:MAG TPA: hypothetical protein VMZ04_03720 [Anaerolineae bacterium]|nr:hypothetical protein [Anaerolineae bacterium]
MKIKQAAKEAKKQGYEYIASVVKQVFATTYYNINHVDNVIESGWKAAPFNTGEWSGPVGQKELPEKTIMRQHALSLIR